MDEDDTLRPPVLLGAVHPDRRRAIDRLAGGVRTAACGALAIVSLWAPGTQAEPPDVGFVLDRVGSWTVEGSQKGLDKGAGVPAGGVLRNGSPSDGDFITVADLNARVIKQIRCKSNVCSECRPSGVCYDPVQPLPPAPSSPGPWAVILEAMRRRIVGDSPRYSRHRVRDRELQPGVAQLVGAQLDLHSMFEEQGRGRYTLRFRSLERGAAPVVGRSVEPVVFDWDPDRPSLVPVGPLRPGLYELVLLEDHPGGLPTSAGSTWVLVSAPANYARLSASFQQAMALVAEWQGYVSPDVASAYLRAFLDALSTSAE